MTLQERIKTNRQEKTTKLIYTTAVIKRDYQAPGNDFCKNIVDNNYTEAYIASIFPDTTKDCLDANNYGLAVILWRKKPNFENIPWGENHYDFDSVIFNNCPAGDILFKRKLFATIFKLYVPAAIKLINDKG